MLNQVIGLRTMLAFMWAVLAVVAVGNFIPDQATGLSAIVLALFNALLGKKPDEPKDG